jgi:hypothetical protein
MYGPEELVDYFFKNIWRLVRTTQRPEQGSVKYCTRAVPGPKIMGIYGLSVVLRLVKDHKYFQDCVSGI